MRKGLGHILKTSDRLQKLGTVPRRALLSTEKSEGCQGRTLSRRKSNVSIAGISSLQENLSTLTSTVPTSVNLRQEEHQASMMYSESVLSAEQYSHAISTEKHYVAPDHVQCVNVTGQKNKVYDLMVEDAEEFFASGVLVHNCRYALEPLMAFDDIAARLAALSG
jgi:hypothetical protein